MITCKIIENTKECQREINMHITDYKKAFDCSIVSRYEMCLVKWKFQNISLSLWESYLKFIPNPCLLLWARFMLPQVIFKAISRWNLFRRVEYRGI